MKRGPSPLRRSAPPRGFTLLELLIATAVGAVVLLVIQTTYFGALRLHNTAHARIDADLLVQRALGIIRRDFAGLMLPGGTLSGQLQSGVLSSPTTGSSGERISPDLYTNSGRVDGWNPFSEVQMVAYYLAPASNGGNAKDLVRVVTRNLLPVQEAIPEEQVILQDVAAAAVSFYDGAGWTDQWDSAETSTLPSGIRLSLQLASPAAGQGSTGTIELVVPVMVVTTTTQTQAEEEAVP